MTTATILLRITFITTRAHPLPRPHPPVPLCPFTLTAGSHPGGASTFRGQTKLHALGTPPLPPPTIMHTHTSLFTPPLSPHVSSLRPRPPPPSPST